MGLLDGKVAIITGAGGGIGREYALWFAKEGAKVVVNDLGGTRDGSGGDVKMADVVVDEIKALGGEAAPNYDSVTEEQGADNIVKTAMDNFGRVDILVNNAGILRDKTMLKMEVGDFAGRRKGASRAGRRRAHHQHLKPGRPDRQLRADQLWLGQGRNRRTDPRERARNAEVQCDGQCHCSGGLHPVDLGFGNVSD